MTHSELSVRLFLEVRELLEAVLAFELLRLNLPLLFVGTFRPPGVAGSDVVVCWEFPLVRDDLVTSSFEDFPPEDL